MAIKAGLDCIDSSYPTQGHVYQPTVSRQHSKNRHLTPDAISFLSGTARAAC
ncbi:hypothetical protein FF011L_54280 [Roseimaritima multifibrata]|uniref:Uncharacterized protein n=1 Tax=Roseimaritima multifibrata TaxID=1930274 RepID=A0A517MP08_9BACT|nr:hypothetical protein FF011L_54280 [Roseimaritima multifibrata]